MSTKLYMLVDKDTGYYYKSHARLHGCGWQWWEDLAGANTWLSMDDMGEAKSRVAEANVKRVHNGLPPFKLIVREFTSTNDFEQIT